MAQRQLAAIMFTDIVGYTDVMQSDEDQAVQMRDRHRQVFEETHSQYDGEIIQYFGDGTLSIFASSLQAVRCAITIQQVLQQKPHVPLRIGIHSGDIIRRDHEIIGDSVNIASRIESLAEPGSILISRQLQSQIFNHRIPTKSLGQVDLKNVHQPVEILAIAVDGIKVPEHSQEVHGGSKVINRNSIAILPFVNMSSDENQEYFCDGITEEIINSLSHVDDLKVIARTSVFMFKNKNEDIRKIGKTLNVNSILEGSVRKAGNRLRITSQLVNAGDGSHFWSQKYDREMDDIFSIQDEISLAIVDALKIKLLGEERDKVLKVETQDVAAYDLYLKGQFEWYKRTGSSMLESIRLYEAALDKDPNYVLAKIGVASAYIALCDWGEIKCIEGLPKAKEILDDALGTHPNVAEVYAALAYYDICSWNFEDYYEHYQKSLSLNNKLPFIHHLDTVAHNVLGDFTRAVISSRQARRLDPLSLIFNFAYGHTRYISGKYEVAVDQFNYVLSLDPQFKPAALFGTFSLIQLERGHEALEMLTSILSFEHQSLISEVERCFQKDGISGLLNWIASGGIQFYGRPHNQDYHRAICYALLDQPDEMFVALRSLYDIRSFRLTGFRHNVIFAKYQDDARFQELSDGIGYPI
ncbi:MAG: guanylate cyclase [Saprospiraceae bacterium]|nr:guanylate cyclase [Saprospiraceae bacterium]